MITYGWPFLPLGQAEVERSWDEQKMYPKDAKGMKYTLAVLRAMNDYLRQGVIFDHGASVPTYEAQLGIGDFTKVEVGIEGQNGAELAGIDLAKV